MTGAKARPSHTEYENKCRRQNEQEQDTENDERTMMERHSGDEER